MLIKIIKYSKERGRVTPKNNRKNKIKIRGMSEIMTKEKKKT